MTKNEEKREKGGQRRKSQDSVALENNIDRKRECDVCTPLWKLSKWQGGHDRICEGEGERGPGNSEVHHGLDSVQQFQLVR